MNTTPRPADLPDSGHYASTHFSVLEAEYQYYLDNALISPWARVIAQTQAGVIVNNRSTYGGFGVPYWFLGILHRMEGDADPLKQIANGEHWATITSIDPKGLGPWSSFAESVPDILANYASPDSWGCDLTKIDSDNYPQWLFRALTWNGLAYNKLTDPNTTPANASPYLYSGTQCGVNPLYVSGKYVADGEFDPKAKSQQVGVLALMLALKSMGAIT